jgi:hypothetical protein
MFSLPRTYVDVSPGVDVLQLVEKAAPAILQALAKIDRGLGRVQRILRRPKKGLRKLRQRSSRHSPKSIVDLDAYSESCGSNGAFSRMTNIIENNTVEKLVYRKSIMFNN